MTHFNILKQEESLSSRLISRRVSYLFASQSRRQQKTASCIILLVFQLSRWRRVAGKEKGIEALYIPEGREGRAGGVTRTTSEVPQVAAECDD